MAPPKRICADCEHSSLGGRDHPSGYACHHPESRDDVTGDPVDCRDARRATNACGPTAALYTAMHPIAIQPPSDTAEETAE